MTTATSRQRDLAGHREVRSFATTLEARDDGGLQFRLDGYASVVESPYDMGSYSETIKRGAFTKTLSERPDVQLLLNHEGLPLARTTNGSLQLTEDPTGLRFTASLDREDPDAKAVMRKIGSGLMDQCSFAFRVTRQTWDADYTERNIHEVSLDRGDVSVVNFGASPTTSVIAHGAPGMPAGLEMAALRVFLLRLRGRAR